MRYGDGNKQKGFTLIELLICMVVIAILAAAMLLASEEVQNSAQAAAIINNMVQLKKAALMYYMDNIDIASDPSFDFAANSVRDEVLKYLDVDKDFLKKVADGNGIRYETFKSADGAWYIWCNMMYTAGASGVTQSYATIGVCHKLAKRAQSSGLFGCRGYDKKALSGWSAKNIEDDNGKKAFYGYKGFSGNADVRRVALMRVR